MNQLSNNVIDFARYRRARDAARARTASGGHHQRLNLLTCHWRRDAASGRLICASGEGRSRCAASFATLSGKLKDPQNMNDGPRPPAEFASGVSTGASNLARSAISNRRAGA
jgi:hypothetical protein